MGLSHNWWCFCPYFYWNLVSDELDGVLAEQLFSTPGALSSLRCTLFVMYHYKRLSFSSIWNFFVFFALCLCIFSLCFQLPSKIELCPLNCGLSWCISWDSLFSLFIALGLQLNVHVSKLVLLKCLDVCLLWHLLIEQIYQSGTLMSHLIVLVDHHCSDMLDVF